MEKEISTDYYCPICGNILFEVSYLDVHGQRNEYLRCPECPYSTLVFDVSKI